eukprot:Opistho-1_new@11929
MKHPTSHFTAAVPHNTCSGRGCLGLRGLHRRRGVRVGHAEVVERAILGKELLEARGDLERARVLAVLEIRPELLEAVQMAAVVIGECLLHEIVKEVLAVLLLEAIAVEAEEALDAIPVSAAGILQGERAKLGVHLAVEVVAQEKRPEAEERVHLTRLPNAETLALARALLVKFVVLVLDKAAVLENLVRRVLEVGQRTALRALAHAPHALRLAHAAREGRRVRRRRRGRGARRVRLVAHDPPDVHLHGRVLRVLRLVLLRRPGSDRRLALGGLLLAGCGEKARRLLRVLRCLRCLGGLGRGIAGNRNGLRRRGRVVERRHRDGRQGQRARRVVGRRRALAVTVNLLPERRHGLVVEGAGAAGGFKLLARHEAELVHRGSNVLRAVDIRRRVVRGDEVLLVAHVLCVD